MDILVSSNQDSRVSWHENLGAGFFGEQKIITRNAIGCKSAYAIDMEGDGDLDVLWEGSKSLSWNMNLGGGEFDLNQTDLATITSGTFNHIHSGDFDGEGDLDIVSAAQGNFRVSWFENLGNGNFGNAETIASTIS